MALSVMLLALIVWGCWYGLSWAATTFLSLEKDVARAVVGAAGAIFVSVLTAVLSQRSNKMREIAEAHRPSKVKTYEMFMAFLVDRLKGAKKGEVFDANSLDDKFLDQWFAFKQGLIVWASPTVIAEYLSMERMSDPSMLMRTDALLRAMRQDLGNSNKGLARGDVMRLFLKPEDHGKVA